MTPSSPCISKQRSILGKNSITNAIKDKIYCAIEKEEKAYKLILHS